MIMARRNHYKEAIRRYENLGRFPNGCKTWDEFCTSMQCEKEDYFALSLMEKPPERGSELYFQRRDDIVFGVLTKRDDGKVGRLCFSMFSAEGKRNEGLFLLDGFSRENLQLEIDPTDDFRVVLRDINKKHCRISKVHTEHGEMEKLLIDQLARWIGTEGVGRGVGLCINAYDADRLLSIRNAFEQIFPRDSRYSSCSKEIVEWLSKLDQTLQEYLTLLYNDLPVQEAKVIALRERIETFRLK